MSLFPLPRRWCLLTTGLPFLAGVLAAPAPLRASRVDFKPPPGASPNFGAQVKLLPNGNMIIVDEYYTPPETGVYLAGAVFLHRPDGTLLSRLMGAKREDRVGGAGVTALANGDFVVASNRWDNGDLVDAGAVTWRSGTADTDAVVTAGNSLVGGSANEQVGDSTFRNPATGARGGGGVVPLRNGNYVVCSPSWNGNRGAVTWARGNGPSAGVITPENSLTGAAPEARVGYRWEGGGVTELANGNYVVHSPYAGMVTWCDGAAVSAGVVSAQNSLAGGGKMSGRCVTALSDGDYTVTTPEWNSARGAVTWCPGSGGRTGEVTAENSLTGASPNDRAGSSLDASAATGGGQGRNEGVIPLTNGNYVVTTPQWDRGDLGDAGAVTWCAGDGSVTGPVTAGNSVTGGAALDMVGKVTALANGNYVAAAEMWDRGELRNAGAARLLPGNGPSTGELTPENSLTGSAAEVRVSGGGVTALTNGNFVVTSTGWKKGEYGGFGAVTWVDGVAGRTGPVTAENSFTGTLSGDQVGGSGEKRPQDGGVVALTNGNYVVASPEWRNECGAVTWGDGARGLYGQVTAENSLTGESGYYVGGHHGSYVPVPGTAAANGGALYGVTPLANGNYVVSSPYVYPPSRAALGAVTWCSGAGPTTGRVGAANSLVSTWSSLYDPFWMGIILPIPCPNGDYIQVFPDQERYSYSSVTPLSGSHVTAAKVSYANSEMGGALDRWPSFPRSLVKVVDCDPAGGRLVVSNTESRLVTVYGELFADAPKAAVRRPGQAPLVSGETLRFHGGDPGGRVTVHLEILNYGAVPLILRAEPSADPAFTLDLAPGEHTVPPGGVLPLPVTFTTPAEPGTRAGVFHLITNAPNLPDFVLNVSATVSGPEPSFTEDLVAPAGSGAYGTEVTCLPNGNIVVTDPEWDAPGPVADAGAVYLYAPGGALISRVTGASAGDRVGAGGVTVLTNGNYVIRSGPTLDGAARSAVTWADGVTGVSGAVTAANSLTAPLPDWPEVILLPNGNYVVMHAKGEDGGGAVTWGDGTRGVAGPMTAANSLTGRGAGAWSFPETPGGEVVRAGGVRVLPNGNYVVSSREAVTLASGVTGAAGVISEENSLVFPAEAGAGYPVVRVLTDGNYIISAPRLTVDGVAETGAVVWGDGVAGKKGAFRAEDALTGGDALRLSGAVYALPGGRYAAGSRPRGVSADPGALTWCAAGGVTTGRVTAGNSLLGFSPRLNPVTISPEGNMLVTVGIERGSLSGVVRMSADAPLTGEPGRERILFAERGDTVGYRVVALDDGNFVVSSMMRWGGAVTWVDGRRGRTGQIHPSNSLTGWNVGSGVVTPLGGGRYVVCSPLWGREGEAPGRGAVTWMDGPTDGAGVVHSGNSIIGSGPDDRLGSYGAVRLAGGNYVVQTAAGFGIAAVTWADGSRPSAFQISAANSLLCPEIQTTVTPLSNGHYVVVNRPTVFDATGGDCSITWGDGRSGVRGPVSAANSLISPAVPDPRNRYGINTHPDGAYSVISPNVENGIGAVVPGSGRLPAGTGALSRWNSVRSGTAAPDGQTMSVSYDTARKRWAVGRPVDNAVTLFSFRAPAAARLAMEEAGGVDLADGALVDFGKLETGLTADRVVTLRNTGGAALRPGALTVEGADFIIVSGPAENAEIPPGGFAEVALRFTAGAPGVRTGALRIASDDPARPVATVRLRGIVTPAEAWPFGENSPAPEITLRAEGGVTARFHAVAGATYQLQRSRDLLTWESLGLVRADDSGEVSFPDPDPAAGSAYYRLKAR